MSNHNFLFTYQVVIYMVLMIDGLGKCIEFKVS